MQITRRIYVSMPADRWLPDNLNALKWGVVDEIEKLGYTPEVFTNPRGKPGLASAKTWSPSDADDIARRCAGAAILGMPRWRFHDEEGHPVLLPTEVQPLRRGARAHARASHLRPGPARRAAPGRLRPTTSAATSGSSRPRPTSTGSIPTSSSSRSATGRRSSRNGVTSSSGYCSSSAATAAAHQAVPQEPGSTRPGLADRLHSRPDDPRSDRAGRRAVHRRDLPVHQGRRPRRAARPAVSARDNVVFEAGYFIGLKGKRNVLIVREAGSKMPADLGGDIYASLPDKADIRRSSGRSPDSWGPSETLESPLWPRHRATAAAALGAVEVGA